MKILVTLVGKWREGKWILHTMLRNPDSLLLSAKEELFISTQVPELGLFDGIFPKVFLTVST